MISHAVAGTTLLILIASWFILLGGVSKVQKVCDGRCRDRTGLYWWIIWFQFLALLLWPAVQVRCVSKRDTGINSFTWSFAEGC